jgi:hypothetical protein
MGHDLFVAQAQPAQQTNHDLNTTTAGQTLFQIAKPNFDGIVTKYC